jgi:hypothetical protein
MDEDEGVLAQIRREQAAVRQQKAQEYYRNLRERGNAIESMGGVHPAMTAQMGAQQHFGQLSAAAGQVNSVIDSEMKSRASQAREARRLEHEKELMRMKSQSDIYGAAIRALMMS